MKNGIKRMAAILMVAALLLSICPIQILSVFAEGPMESVLVTVVDKVTGLPVDGSSVLLNGETEITDENGVAEFYCLAPTEVEAQIPYEVTAVKDGYASATGNVTLAFGEVSTSLTLQMVPVADLTVNVHFNGKPLTDAVTVTLIGSQNLTASTVNGVATFAALPLDGNYSVSVVKPGSVTGDYYVSDSVAAAASAGSFSEITLNVQKKTTLTTELSFSIQDGSNALSGVKVLKNSNAVLGLCYDLYSMVCSTPFWQNTDNVSITLNSNNGGKAYLSDGSGNQNAMGKYLTVTAVTPDTSPITFTASEKNGAEIIAERTYTLKVLKANESVIYKVCGTEFAAGATLNFPELGSTLTFAAEGAFETTGTFVLNVTPNDALEVKNNNAISNKKATTGTDGKVIAVPVIFTRSADAWYNAASVSFNVQSLRDVRPEAGFGSVSYEDITVKMSDPQDFSVAPVIDMTGAPEGVADSDPKITYTLKDQTIYNMADNTSVTKTGANLVTIGKDGTAKINPDYYGTATVEATIADTDCFLTKTVFCTLTVVKDIVDNEEKPFVLTYTDNDGNNQVIPYTYSDGQFVADGDWINAEITLTPAAGYTVSVNGTDVSSTGIKLAPGESSTPVSFNRGIFSADNETLITRSDYTKPEVSFSLNSDAFVAFIDTIAVFAGDVQVQISATDEHSGIANVYLDLNGTQYEVACDEKGNYVYTLSSASIENVTSIEVYAVDNAGLESEYSSAPESINETENTVKNGFKMISDGAAPEIKVIYSCETYPDTRNVFSDVDGHLPVISVEINEANYSLGEKARYSLTGPVEKTGEINNSNDQLCDFNGDEYPDGEYTLTISYTDIADHEAKFTDSISEASYEGVYTYTFIKDTVAPQITVNYSATPVGTFPGEGNCPVYSEVNNSLPKITVSMKEDNYGLTEKMSVSCKDSVELNEANDKDLVTIDLSDNDFPDGVYNLTFAYTDIAGHPATINVIENAPTEVKNAVGEYSQKFIKDTVAPSCKGIMLENKQDTINGMEFYKSSTTGKATAAEQFFNANLFVLTSNGAATTVNWTNYPENPAVGGFALSGDGHYTLQLTGSDDAKHVMQTYQYPYTVVLDGTAPVISMTTPDPVNEQDGNRYYDGDVTCTIQITEENFYNSGNVQVMCTLNGSSYPIGGVSWSGGGSANTGTFSLTQEGTYHIIINYSDPSGNPGTYTCEYAIIIDKTSPSATITDAADKPLEDQTSYNADNISFQIELEDENLVGNDILVELTGWVAEEDENGKLILSEKDFASFISDVKASDDEKTFQIDIKNLKDDAVYTLHVSGNDLAGNPFDEVRMFSVNRNGSTYYIDGKTAELVEKYFTNEAIDVEIHEVCAEELKTTDISISHNLDVEKYQFEAQNIEKRFDVKQQEDSKWNEYLYQVMSTNFVEEGTYGVATSSVTKGTDMKKASSDVVAVEFLMDTTVPTVNVAGVEDGGRYKTDAQEITITCQDDQMLQHVEVWLDDVLLEEVDFEDEMLSSKDITVQIPGANEYREQQLRVVVQDKAGNEPTETTVGVFVSTNLWYLYRYYIMIGGGVLLAGAAALIVLLKRKKTV